MLVIVGLGNPGQKYEKTRHNVGFMTVDQMHDKWGFGPWYEKFDCLLSAGQLFSKQILLAKPQMYMNLSGTPVAALMRYYKITPKENLWVIHDDLDLVNAVLRIRDLPSGAGGHRGILSLFQRLETQDFTRFKIGIGKPVDQVPIENYVVEPFKPEELTAINLTIGRAVEAAQVALAEGISKAQSLYNNR